MFFSAASRKLWRFCASLLACCCGGCYAPLPPSDYPPPEEIIFYDCEVIRAYPHDTKAFTQGLEYKDGWIYEGTGLNGKSSIRKVTLETGEAVQQQSLASSFFGEGITIQNNRLIQLTWRSNRGFVYDLESFEEIGDFSYLGEGWGITHDGSRFIMSDGTSRLRFLDLRNFEEKDSLHVRYGREAIRQLNELEYIDGRIYANIWQQDRIAIICPKSGYVTGWINCSGLLSREEAARADVLNGTAWDAEEERLFVTGKYWPWLFEIRLVESERRPYPAVE
ncbi:MAG: glutaminyl-peptide cyclotransferase [Candidatus Hydrogenedens sp.]|jgi:glutamine cyclotransferase|nr:glutaminyl-peptide cyclotransferase [Candidatus Hydrogenedens sp.]